MRWLTAMAMLVLAPAAIATAESPRPFSFFADTGSWPQSAGWSLFASCDGLEMSLANSRLVDSRSAVLTDERVFDDAAGTAPSDGPAAETGLKRPNHFLGSLLAAATVAGTAVNSLLDGPSQSFHFTQEGFFGQGTYTGGADKAAHLVDYYIISKELGLLYAKLGYSPTESRWLGFGVAGLAGLVNEVGDGTNKYGFSYEDLVMDLVGAGTAALVSTLGANDLVGFRHGFLLPVNKDTCCQVPGLGRDYSNEIFTGDFKIAGLARRLGWNVGPLQYLLLSVTYGTKGYPSGFPDQRERQVGIEIGLSLEQILDDVGARRNKWWGHILHMAFDNIRLPFTGVGFRYDVNHGRWHGPNSGN